jgi:hypothetical protein
VNKHAIIIAPRRELMNFKPSHRALSPSLQGRPGP